MSTEHAADAPATESSGIPVSRSRYIWLLALIAVIVVLVDVISKQLVLANLVGHPPLSVAGGLLYLQVIENSGAAFSLGANSGVTWVFSLVMIAVLVLIVWVAPKVRSRGWAIGLGLVFGGALGNLLDRIFRDPGFLQGRVVDFLSLFAPNGQGWAIFNIADSAICVGGVVIVLMALFGRDYDGKSARRRLNSPTEETK